MRNAFDQEPVRPASLFVIPANALGRMLLSHLDQQLEKAGRVLNQSTTDPIMNDTSNYIQSCCIMKRRGSRLRFF